MHRSFVKLGINEDDSLEDYIVQSPPAEILTQ
jgi:hypothetical protein